MEALKLKNWNREVSNNFLFDEIAGKKQFLLSAVPLVCRKGQNSPFTSATRGAVGSFHYTLSFVEDRAHLRSSLVAAERFISTCILPLLHPRLNY